MDMPITHTRYKFWPVTPKVTKVIAGIFILAVLLWSFRQQQPGLSVTAQHLVFSTARHALFEDYLPLRVKVEPLKTLYLDTLEGGRVEKIWVEEGQEVQQGQVLVELSNIGLQLDLISREAQVSEQLNALRNTKLAIEQNRLQLKRELMETRYQLQRIEHRFARREKIAPYISKEELEALINERDYLHERLALAQESQTQEQQLRQQQLQQLDANTTRQEQNLLLARNNLDSLQVRAPRAGRLTAFDIELGESKNRGDRLGQIDDLAHFKLSATLSEFYTNKISIGQDAELVIDNTTYRLKLDKIYPEVKNNEFKIDLLFSDSPPNNIRRGQTLSARLLLSEREQVLLIDNGSFVQDSGGIWAFVLTANKKTAHRRALTLGRKNPSFIEVNPACKLAKPS